MLIILSWIGVAIQLAIVKRQIQEFSIREFVNKVIARESFAYIIPLCFALYCLSCHFSVLEAIAVAFVAEILCMIVSALIGLNTYERLYIKNLIFSKIKKNV